MLGRGELGLKFLSHHTLVFPFHCHLCKLQFELLHLISQLTPFHAVALVREELLDEDLGVALHTSIQFGLARQVRLRSPKCAHARLHCQ